MPQRVLDVGQCDMDHGMIRRLIQDHFDAEVIRAHGAAEALTALRAGSFELVLTNRLMDRDQSEGLDLIRQVKAHGADVGIGYDGDADRIGVIDDTGSILWGD